MNDSVRRAVFSRCGGRCEDCGERHPLTFHHLHYDTVGNESPDDIAALCWDCHRARHRDEDGQYWREEREKNWYWGAFWESMTKDD